MRCIILADIHSNLSSLMAVLKDVETKGGYDEIWCLGDLVGYGPDPVSCLKFLKGAAVKVIAGNHDWGTTGKIDISSFNQAAAEACRWTKQNIDSSDIEFIDNLPEKIIYQSFTLAHGSPREPIWEYVLSVDSAIDNYSYFNTRYCLVGHSHIPLLFEYDENSGQCTGKRLAHGDVLELGQKRLIINPGGVGQPRDGDPRAAYAIYDSEKSIMVHYRVAYDINITQQRMTDFGLPLTLIRRLSQGM